MKKTLIIFSVVMITAISSFSQTRIREVGVSFANLDYFGLTYRTGSEKALWRFNVISMNVSRNESVGSAATSVKNSGAGIGFEIGREFRRPITDDFQFRYGFDISCAYTSSTSEYVSPSNHTKTTLSGFVPGLQGVLGVNLKLNERFLIGAELNPQFSYRLQRQKIEDVLTNEQTEHDVPGYYFSISEGATLTLVYRFNKDGQ